MSSPKIDGPSKNQNRMRPLPPATGWQKVENALGYAWKTISHLPANLYRIVIQIKKIVKDSFAAHFSSKTSTKEMKLKNPSPEVTSLFQDNLPPKKKIEKPQLEVDYNLDNLFDEKGTSETDSNSKDALTSSSSDSKLEQMDLLGSAAAIAPQKPKIQPKPSFARVEKKKAIPKEQEEIQKKLEEARKVVAPAEQLLNEMKARHPLTLQEYLECIEILNHEFEKLKKPATKFRERSLLAYRVVQATIKKLEIKMGEWEKEICLQVNRHYQPNPNIPGDGNCLFWSIRDARGNKFDQKKYRQIAADYLRLNAEGNNLLMTGIKDVIKEEAQLEEPQRRHIERYAESQGGLQAWVANLTKKLEREPTLVELYCDCLANSPSEGCPFWGGWVELYAISEQLGVPIVVFTSYDEGQTLKFHSKTGGQFSDKPPILLYYQDGNHYQDFVPIG